MFSSTSQFLLCCCSDVAKTKLHTLNNALISLQDVEVWRLIFVSIVLLVTFNRNILFQLDVRYQPQMFMCCAQFSQWKGCTYLKADWSRDGPNWNIWFLLVIAQISHWYRVIVHHSDW